VSGSIRHTSEELRQFARVSGDFNPLHTSAAYARRTPWGEPVVFGVLGALRCLALGRPRPQQQLASLSVEFPGAMFAEVSYEARLAEDGDLMKVRLQDGRKTVLKLTAQFRQRAPAPLPGAAGQPARLRQEAADHAAAALVPGLTASAGFTPDPSGLRAFMQQHDLDERGVPAWQVAAIMAQSYVVGMELPGRRALFSSLAIEFEALAATPAFHLTARVAELDERFSLASIAVDLRPAEAGPLLSSARLSALVRAVLPAPDPDQLTRLLPVSRRMAERVAVVTGASRGLGAAITRALLSQGCTVLGTYAQSDDEMAALAASTQALPGKLVTCKADAASTEAAVELHRRLTAEHGQLDFLICNASPSLRAFTFEPATLERVNHFIQHSLALTSVPVAHLLPLVEAQRGHVVFISSQAVTAAPKGWSHYVAAKTATEGLLRGVAAECPRVRVSAYRPPRLLTDFTNLPLGNEGALAPEVVAVRLVTDLLAQMLAPAAPASGLQVVEDFAAGA
jgi:NAD(P)-dependent dehydrogenase (short-subunit alcohol dehydrogenase family)